MVDPARASVLVDRASRASHTCDDGKPVESMRDVCPACSPNIYATFAARHRVPVAEKWRARLKEVAQ